MTRVLINDCYKFHFLQNSFLYRLLKPPAQLALLLYCRHLKINQRQFCSLEGPLLLASNHPNSFLDAVLLATLFRKPVYSLARGDVFTTGWSRFLLRQLNILPVYRKREGAGNLQKNYETFNACKDIFKNNGVVLIFSEALCENEWHLRPLKKGTARLATAAWEAGIPLSILPVALNYSSFTSFGKNVHLNFGTLITKEQYHELLHHDGILLNSITGAITRQLQERVHEIPKENRTLRSEIFSTKPGKIKTALLLVPAIAGYLLHLPLYLPLRLLLKEKALPNGHYDSVMVGSMFLLYPFYLLLPALLLYVYLGGAWFLLSFIAVPFCAWSFVQLKRQID